jgi:hypothetical protein
MQQHESIIAQLWAACAPRAKVMLLWSPAIRALPCAAHGMPRGYLLKAGQLEYDCRYSKMHGMPVTGGRGFRSLKPLWYNGVPP